MQIKFKAKNKNGKIILEDNESFKLHLLNMPEDVHVSVHKITRQRTNQMNKYYWGVVVHLISEHTGYEPEEVHEYCKIRFNKEIVNINNDEIEIGKSTASLKVHEFNAYVSRIVQWASFELSLIIPSPEETV